MDNLSYIKQRFKKSLGYSFDSNNIISLNAKIQYKKLYDRNPLLVLTADKYAVREYVKNFGINLINIYGVFDNFKEINFDNLPVSFVIKATHGSGWTKIIQNKNKEWKDIEILVNKWLSTNYYDKGGEWCYKDISPKIIIEEKLDNNILDYKFFCFHHEPVLLQVDYNRFINHQRNFYDLHWNLLPFTYQKHDNTFDSINKPNNFIEMIDIARILSKDFDFVRVDLYTINNQIYFGELTHYPGNGFGEFIPVEWDFILGSYWEQGGYHYV